MSEKKYLVELSRDERAQLESLVRKEKAAALVLTRARILLKADQDEHGPAWYDARPLESVIIDEAFANLDRDGRSHLANSEFPVTFRRFAPRSWRRLGAQPWPNSFRCGRSTR